VQFRHSWVWYRHANVLLQIWWNFTRSRMKFQLTKVCEFSEKFCEILKSFKKSFSHPYTFWNCVCVSAVWFLICVCDSVVWFMICVCIIIISLTDGCKVNQSVCQSFFINFELQNWAHHHYHPLNSQKYVLSLVKK
jgi:hypothetical protein